MGKRGRAGAGRRGLGGGVDRVCPWPETGACALLDRFIRFERAGDSDGSCLSGEESLALGLVGGDTEDACGGR